MKNLGVFETEEKAKEFAKNNNGFTKKRLYKTKIGEKSFWYVYEKAK